MTSMTILNVIFIISNLSFNLILCLQYEFANHSIVMFTARANGGNSLLPTKITFKVIAVSFL
jgi:hypothetical protein